MFFDLNVPVGPTTESSFTKGQTNKKDKAKQPADPVLSENEQKVLDARLDTLVHLGYTVVALNQTIRGVYNSTTHVNTLATIKERKDILILKRLTIILTEDSEKGFGLVTSNADALKAYDIIALCPTNSTTYSLACLTHSVPSPVAAHIISLDMQSNPRLPFLKLSTLKTAMKNGAVFEICYSAAVKRAGPERQRRNWWGNAKEFVRQTGGKGIIFSSGGYEADVRGPKDVINLATILGCKQDLALHALSTTPKSMTLRAQTRQTYRAVLSEPKLIMPSFQSPAEPESTSQPESEPDPEPTITAEPQPQPSGSKRVHEEVEVVRAEPSTKKRRKDKQKNKSVKR